MVYSNQNYTYQDGHRILIVSKCSPIRERKLNLHSTYGPVLRSAFAKIMLILGKKSGLSGPINEIPARFGPVSL